MLRDRVYTATYTLGEVTSHLTSSVIYAAAAAAIYPSGNV